ncbi:MAG: phosphate regulon transcriptional regulatory protein PhoB [Candidatus Pelagibacter sp. TMED153]|mgnify:CR=1 FL=1|nr:MAG: phosphate regulon transcriptional regulatory protein PhoB [Candidatus Pelagibacter sp. TMED153]
MNKKVLLIEDDKDLQEIVSYNFSKEGFVINSCLDGEDAMEMVKNENPDLIILDWMLPNVSGVEILRQIRSIKKYRKIPVIMLTAKNEETDRLKAFDGGADDYISKPFSNAELIARSKAILRRIKPEDFADSLNFHDIELNRDTKRVFRGKKEIKLGPVEFKLLEVFLMRPGQVFSREQLLDKIWGNEIYVEDRTVDVHVGRLRRALNRGKAKKDPIRTVRSSGYSLNEKYS